MTFKLSTSALKTAISIMTCAAMLACAPPGSEGPRQDPPYDPGPVLKEDLKTIAKTESRGPLRFDRMYNNSFSLIFGGTTGQDIENYFKERVKYSYSYLHPVATKLYMLLMSRERKWAQSSDPNKHQNQFSNLFISKESDDGKGMAGINLGTLFWYDSIVDRNPITLDLDGETVEVTSPRVGIIAVGPAYRDSITVHDGTTNRTFPIPPEVRYSVLLHEARHSDCPGGIADSDLDVIRNAQSSEEFNEKFGRRDCGHFHATCLEGDLKGIVACDSIPWGSYTISGIYLSAMLENQTDDIANRIIRAYAQDSWSRLILNKESMLRHDYGLPEMTSGGLRED